MEPTFILVIIIIIAILIILYSGFVNTPILQSEQRESGRGNYGEFDKAIRQQKPRGNQSLKF